MTRNLKPLLAAFAAGAVFSVGLVLAGMTDPQKVQAFLDVTGDWDPSLAFVMGGAVVTHGLLRLLIRRRTRPILAPSFPNAPSRRVDVRLLAGAGLFGLGWGLSGYCPGPALTSVATGGTTLLAFVLSMLGGMSIFHMWARLQAARVKAAPAIEAP